MQVSGPGLKGSTPHWIIGKESFFPLEPPLPEFMLRPAFSQLLPFLNGRFQFQHRVKTHRKLVSCQLGSEEARSTLATDEHKRFKCLSSIAELDEAEVLFRSSSLFAKLKSVGTRNSSSPCTGLVLLSPRAFAHPIACLAICLSQTLAFFILSFALSPPWLLLQHQLGQPATCHLLFILLPSTMGARASGHRS